MSDQAELMGRYRESISHFDKDALIEMNISLQKIVLSNARAFINYRDLIGKVHRLLRTKKFRDAADLAKKLSTVPAQDPMDLVSDIEAVISGVQRERRESIQVVDAGPCSAEQPSSD